MCSIQLDFLCLQHFFNAQGQQNLSLFIFLSLTLPLRQHFDFLRKLIMFVIIQKLSRSLYAFAKLTLIELSGLLHLSLVYNITRVISKVL